MNLRPLTSVQTLLPTELSGHEFNSHSEPTISSFVNCSSCTNLELNAGWTHALIAHSVRASERNSVVGGLLSHSFQLSIATSKTCSMVNAISISSFRSNHGITSTKRWLNQCGDIYIYISLSIYIDIYISLSV